MTTPEIRRRPDSSAWMRLASGALFAITALLAMQGAHAQAPDTPIGWEPGLALGFGLHSQELDGRFSTDLTSSTGATLTLGRGGTNDFLGQHVEPSLSLDAPPFYEEGLRPRLFLHAGGQFPTSDEHIARRWLRTYAGGGPNLPVIRANCAGPNPSLCIVRPKNKLLFNGGWYTGLGVDVRLPITVLEKRNFHLRTSLDYYGQSWKGRTVISRFSIINPPGNAGITQDDIIRSSSDDKVVHGFGPRVQLSIALAQRAGFRWDLFATGQFYWLVSSNQISYDGRNQNGDTSRATTQAKPYVGQFGFGIRMVWTGREGY